MDSRISTLTGPIFFGKEEVWIEKLPPQLAQFFRAGVSMESKTSTLTGPIFFGKEEVWIPNFPP